MSDAVKLILLKLQESVNEKDQKIAELEAIIKSTS